VETETANTRLATPGVASNQLPLQWLFFMPFIFFMLFLFRLLKEPRPQAES
jgi:hypothetical protein